MFEINEGYLYTHSNQWIQIKNNIAKIGIDDYSQNEFGEIVYIDLPQIGHNCIRNQAICVIESAKTASDLHSPLSGEIIKINEKLIDNPKLINKSCYNEGWLLELKLSNNEEVNDLMSSDKYKQYVL